MALLEWVVSPHSLPYPSLGPDTHKAAAGASGLNLAGPAGAHTCPPSAAHALGEAPGAGMLRLLPEALSCKTDWSRRPTVGTVTWRTRKRKDSWAELQVERHILEQIRI